VNRGKTSIAESRQGGILTAIEADLERVPELDEELIEVPGAEAELVPQFHSHSHSQSQSQPAMV
jgi:hypothetical protein